MGNKLGMLRYVSMTDRASSYPPRQDPNCGRARTIQAPQRHEGIGNALRAAFDPASYGMPDELRRLLRLLD